MTQGCEDCAKWYNFISSSFLALYLPFVLLHLRQLWIALRWNESRLEEARSTSSNTSLPRRWVPIIIKSERECKFPLLAFHSTFRSKRTECKYDFQLLILNSKIIIFILTAATFRATNTLFMAILICVRFCAGEWLPMDESHEPKRDKKKGRCWRMECCRLGACRR